MHRNERREEKRKANERSTGQDSSSILCASTSIIILVYFVKKINETEKSGGRGSFLAAGMIFAMIIRREV